MLIACQRNNSNRNDKLRCGQWNFVWCRLNIQTFKRNRIIACRTDEEHDRSEIHAEHRGERAHDEADEPHEACDRAVDARPLPLVQHVPEQSYRAYMRTIRSALVQFELGKVVHWVGIGKVVHKNNNDDKKLWKVPTEYISPEERRRVGQRNLSVVHMEVAAQRFHVNRVGPKQSD